MTRSRFLGSREATGDVLVFLDSHSEALPDWLRPLLQRIKQKRDAVLVPIIDMISTKTLEYDSGNTDFEVRVRVLASMWPIIP